MQPFRFYRSKKYNSARVMAAGSLADVQTPVKQPVLKHACKRAHRWVVGKFNRRCTRCGLEEMKDITTGTWPSA